LIPADLKRRIASVEETFRKVAPGVKWVAEENLHVTLKFLGNVAAERTGSVEAALVEAVQGAAPFEIEVAGAGAFPGPAKPRTVWIGITSGSEALAELARRIDKRLEKLGFAREDRPFRSHVTIGRVKDPHDAMDLGPALTGAQVGVLGSALVGSIALMRSDLRPEGPIYSVLAEIPLGGSGKGG
jgi:2'-5' RNA ligase